MSKEIDRGDDPIEKARVAIQEIRGGYTMGKEVGEALDNRLKASQSIIDSLQKVAERMGEDAMCELLWKRKRDAAVAVVDEARKLAPYHAPRLRRVVDAYDALMAEEPGDG